MVSLLDPDVNFSLVLYNVEALIFEIVSLQVFSELECKETVGVKIIVNEAGENSCFDFNCSQFTLLWKGIFGLTIQEKAQVVE